MRFFSSLTLATLIIVPLLAGEHSTMVERMSQELSGPACCPNEPAAHVNHNAGQIEQDLIFDKKASVERSRSNGPNDDGYKNPNKEELRKNTPAEAPMKPLPSRFRFINDAYQDASTILAEDNSCSRFFGNPGAALVVLPELAKRLQMTRLEFGVGIRMSGPDRAFIDDTTKTSYRLFHKAEVNTNGPFGRKHGFPGEPSVPSVGSFQPGTRQARALMLLHELGHLIKGLDGRWLLPDDGNNEYLSQKNTLLIEARCGDQIKALQLYGGD